jgi:hypothetical protein
MGFWIYQLEGSADSCPQWAAPQTLAWTWTPESGNPLSSPAVNAGAFEASVFNCLGEWLNGYFNNGMHTVNNGATPVLFPFAYLKFQQQKMPQPLEGAVIWSLMEDQGKLVEKQVRGQYQGWQNIQLGIYVRASLKKDNPDGANADYLCSQVADRLYGLLSDRGASVPLQQKGFHTLRASPPGIRNDVLYKTRKLTLTCRVIFGTPATSANLGGD